MIPAGTRRRKKLRRFSRNAGLCADSICDVSELLRMSLAALKRLTPSICGTVLRLPFGSTVESWLPQAKRVPAT